MNKTDTAPGRTDDDGQPKTGEETTRELHAKILDDLSARESWEAKQRVYYELRHEGIRRQNKPFPGAADLHYPLVDGTIDKFKPFYFAQIFGNEVVAQFIALDPAGQEYASDVAQWFDYQLTQETNLFPESLSLIDNMLMSGAAPLKTMWDERRKKLTFDAIDPLFLIYPEGTTDLDEADRITHVMQFTVDKYRRDGRFKSDDRTIDRIKGDGKGASEVDAGGKAEAKYQREGLTFGEKNQIVVWEVYQQQDDRTWRVKTFSPTAPELELRPEFALPEEYDGQPFVLFPAEIKDKGAYAARGIAERGAPFETYLCKVWNEKADAMTFVNRPIFTRDGGIGGNLGNVKLIPGQIVPGNIKRVEMGNTPFDFGSEMQGTRLTAEQLFALPDFGLGREDSPGQKKTATEVQHMAGLMSMSTDLRSWIFRWALTKVWRKAWKLLQKRGAQALQYYFDKQARALKPGALGGKYSVLPDGSPDGWNKNQRAQRAAQRYMQFFGKPYINQGELTKHCLEEDDPRIAKRLYQEPQLAAASQSEDQAMECLLLEMGFPAQVEAADDDNTHLTVIAGRAQMLAQLGHPLPAPAAQAYLAHVGEHLKKLHEANPAAAKQWLAKLQPFERVLQMMSQPGAAPTGAAPAAQTTEGGGQMTRGVGHPQSNLVPMPPQGGEGVAL